MLFRTIEKSIRQRADILREEEPGEGARRGPGGSAPRYSVVNFVRMAVRSSLLPR
jgi:hypothetical protein